MDGSCPTAQREKRVQEQGGKEKCIERNSSELVTLGRKKNKNGRPIRWESSLNSWLRSQFSIHLKREETETRKITQIEMNPFFFFLSSLATVVVCFIHYATSLVTDRINSINREPTLVTHSGPILELFQSIQGNHSFPFDPISFFFHAHRWNQIEFNSEPVDDGGIQFQLMVIFLNLCFLFKSS